MYLTDVGPQIHCYSCSKADRQNNFQIESNDSLKEICSENLCCEDSYQQKELEDLDSRYSKSIDAT
jgi:hypothetical protein